MPNPEIFFPAPKTKNSKHSYSSFLSPSFFLMTMATFSAWAIFIILKSEQLIAKLEANRSNSSWHNSELDWKSESQNKLLSCQGYLNATGFGYLTLDRFLGACSELNRHDSLKSAGQYASSIFSKVPTECLQTLSTLCGQNENIETIEKDEDRAYYKTTALGLGFLMTILLLIRCNIKAEPANNKNNDHNNDPVKLKF